MDGLIEATDLNVWFQRDDGTLLHAVRDVSLALARGERAALIGESGSGKSTVLHAMLGLLPQNAWVSGSIRIGGQEVLTDGERDFRPHRWSNVAIVFQGAMSALNPVRTVGSQIEEVLAHRTSVRGRAAERRVGEVLDLVELARAVAQRYPHELSGGMRQRACIAMALSCSPKVLLADEPTTALDAIVAAGVAGMLVSLSHDLGLSLLLVSHDLDLACNTCEQVSVMRRGTIVEEGTARSLATDAQHPYTRELFSGVLDLDDAGGDAPVLGGRNDTVLEITDLSVQYKPRRRGKAGGAVFCAVDGVSLTLARGELLALIGESGSGKTSLAQSIIRLVPFQEGRIVLDGTDVGDASSRDLRKVRSKVQMVFQDPYGSLDPRMTVRRLVGEALDIHRIATTAALRESTISEALERAELAPADEYLDRYPHQLSGGERQRVALASAIVVKPDLLIADEPVSMLDVSLRAGILKLLDDLRRETNLAILMITHDIATAMHHAQTVAVMRNGRIVEYGPTRSVVACPRHPYTKALLSAVPRRAP